MLTCTADGLKVLQIELAKLWTLAERCLIPNLQNAAMMVFLRPGDNLRPGVKWLHEATATREVVSQAVAEVMQYVYDTHPSESPLTRACVYIMFADWKNPPSERLKWANQLYEAILGPGLALDLLVLLRSADVDYSNCLGIPVKNFLLDTEDNVEDFNGDNSASDERLGQTISS